MSSNDQELNKWLNICVNQHNYYDKVKMYFPEKFNRHRLSRPIPNAREVLDL